MNFDLKLYFELVLEMDALTTAYDSSDGEDDSKDQVIPEIDPQISSRVISELKEKFPLNSAPQVPIKVSTNKNKLH